MNFCAKFPLDKMLTVWYNGNFGGAWAAGAPIKKTIPPLRRMGVSPKERNTLGSGLPFGMGSVEPTPQVLSLQNCDLGKADL